MGDVVSTACFGNVLHVICTGGVGSSIDSIISNVGVENPKRTPWHRLLTIAQHLCLLEHSP